MYPLAMLSREEVLRRFGALRQANLATGQRAPHKPLLVLYLLAQLQARSASRERLIVPYREIDERVGPLIETFGPPAKGAHRAALPFFHLDQSVWKLEGERLGPGHARLRDAAAAGGLLPEVEEALRADPSLIVEVARRLLESNFPETYVPDLCAAIGLDLEAPDRTAASSAPRRVFRSPEFRRAVLRAYEHACAFCGYEGHASSRNTSGLEPVGVAAAHVKWFAYGGPDEVCNGLALCDLHHTLFDRGMLGLSEDCRILVSHDFMAKSDVARKLVKELDGREIRRASHPRAAIAPEFVAWHREQVFRTAA
jgi:putative restriction endonuclease